jgi:hypothetical protein
MERLFETKRNLGIPDRRLREDVGPSCDVPSPAPTVSKPPEKPKSDTVDRVVDAVLEKIERQR